MDGDVLLVFASAVPWRRGGCWSSGAHQPLTDNNSEGILHCYLWPRAGSPIGGFVGEGYHNEYGPAFVVHGDEGPW